MDGKSDKLLILDLDETLIYAAEDDLGFPPDFQFDKYLVYKRPFLEEFLVDISDHYTIGIWSSADDQYVAEIVNAVKPASVEFEIIWGRSRCSLKRDRAFDDYYYDKPLSKLKNKGFNIERILIVDDSPEKTKSNYGNAIYIKAYSGDNADEELRLLYSYLLSIKNQENVRTIEKRGWRNMNGMT